MSYIPKTIRGKMNFKNITDEEIAKGCSSKSEVETVRKFYEKLDGVELCLSLWDYDKRSSYHLSGWSDEVDNLMMEAIFILEKEFGVYEDFEDFKEVWKAKEYDSGGTTVFPLNCVEVLEVLCEESNELSDKEKLDLINTIEVIDISSSGGEIEYILVKNNEVNRGILNKIGITDKEIEEECSPEDDLFDISSIGGRYANYFDGKRKKFINK